MIGTISVILSVTKSTHLLAVFVVRKNQLKKAMGVSADLSF
jgi:hypothetical protein